MPFLFFHILAGAVGLVSGAAALSAGKGSRPHRAAGNVFFISMLIMSAGGFVPGLVQTGNDFRLEWSVNFLFGCDLLGDGKTSRGANWFV